MPTETEQDRYTVTDTGRVAIVATYHGPTNSNGSRITVRRAGGGGKRLTVGWDHSLNTGENYADAVRQYVTLMGWGGRWTVGATATGAVATWAGQA